MADAAELERLRVGAAGFGLELSAEAAGKLVGYEALVRRWNEKFNLVSRRDVGRFRSRHLLDSLSIAPLLGGSQVLDIGSGAGLPGLPLAIVHPHRQFVLVDRSERKARFLEHVSMTLDLGNVTVRCVDAGELSGEAFDTIVCRAVAALHVIWRLARSRLAVGGRLLFMSRTDTAAPPQLTSIRLDGGRVWACPVEVPGLSAHHEVLVVESCQ